MKTPQLAAASLFLAALVPAVSNAATIQMVGNNTSDESWLTAGDWSNNAAPTSDNDYVVGAGFEVRSPSNMNNATFGGRSLTVTGAGAALLLRTQSNGYTSTIGNLTISNGATIRNAFSAAGGVANTQVINGDTLTFLGGDAGYVTIRTGGTAGAQASSTGPRNFIFNSQVLGSGEVRLQDRGTITLGNATNAFSGTWVVGGGPNNTTAELTTRLAMGSGAGSYLGNNASVTLQNHSYLDLTYDWSTSGSLTLGSNATDAAQIKFTNSISVGSLSIAGTSLAAGTYTYGDFVDLGYASYFDGTTGTISVIPEPSTFAALAGLGVLSLAALRRGRRHGRA